MLDICSHSKEGKPVHLQEIANRNNLSKGYLEQLVLALKNAQLLKSTSGRNGGYQLIRAPERISLLDVVEAVIGPINLVECVGYPEECLRSDGCECRVLWELINCRITAVLGDY
ncbi:MAG: RrF2 family transcriptional regulator, partial [bacterium]